MNAIHEMKLQDVRKETDSLGEVNVPADKLVLTVEGLWPGIQYPRIPGHEVVGIVDELGAGVSKPDYARASH